MKKIELWEKVNKENNGEIADFIFYLRERWQDEKDYEDISDYLIAIQKYIPCAYKICKRPFGVICKCDDGNIQIYVKSTGKYLKICGRSV